MGGGPTPVSEVPHHSARARHAGARFDRRQFTVRLIMVAALALAAALIPGVGERRLIVAAFLVIFVFPAHLVIRSMVGVPNPTGWLDALAVMAAAVVAIIEPAAWPAAFLFQMLNLGGAVAFLSPRWTLTLGLLSISSMSLVAAMVDTPNPVPLLVVASLFFPALVVGAQAKKSKEQRSTERVRTLVDSVPVLVWEAETGTGALRSVAGHTKTLFGRDQAELLGASLANHVHPADRARYERRLAGTLTAPMELEYRYWHGDGRWVWLRDRTQIVVTARGPVVRGVTSDITAERAARLSLLRQEEIVNRMSSVVIVLESPQLGPRSPVRQISGSLPWWEPTDHPSGSNVFGEIFPALANNSRVRSACSNLIAGRTFRLDALVIEESGLGERHVEVELFSLEDGSATMIIEDVTDREEAFAQVRWQAEHDSLTGLANRASLLDNINRELFAGQSVALLLIDLNDFKGVNDALGHFAGDELLKAIGTRLDHTIRARDMVARLGGDEFAVMLRGADQISIRSVVATIVERCRDTVVIDGASVATSASVGVALGPLHGEDAETLLRCADIAMYEAKRDQVDYRTFDPSLATTPTRLRLLSDLRDAFIHDQFEVFFQASIDLRSRATVGVEALVRWRHPELGLLEPDEFLEVVAIAGLLDELTDAVLWQSVEAATGLPDHLTVAVNLSANSLRRSDLTQRVLDTMAAHGVNPGRLIFELTESEVMNEFGTSHLTLAELADLGVTVAVDDFGTGYSSFTHLRALPLGELKIDRRFVSGLRGQGRDAVIVRSMIDLGHNLGLRVTAEGVEDQVTLDLLADMGCDHSQGFLFHRPMPLEELVQWLNTSVSP